MTLSDKDSLISVNGRRYVSTNCISCGTDIKLLPRRVNTATRRCRSCAVGRTVSNSSPNTHLFINGKKFKRSICHPSVKAMAKGLCSKCYRHAYPHAAESVRRATRKWQLNNPGKVKAGRTKWLANGGWLRMKYGITKDHFKTMLLSQNHKCAICRQFLAKPKIDHCHSTGVIRGILCTSCNYGLGCFKDNPGSLQRAALYVSKMEKLP